MVDIKKMIKKTGHYPVKDRKTGRISLVRPKGGVNTEEKLDAAVDRFYYENDIEYRNPKNWNPLPRRLRGVRPVARRAFTSRNVRPEDGGGEDSSDGDDDEDNDEDDHTATSSRSHAPHRVADSGIRQAQGEPEFFDVDSEETSSLSQRPPNAHHSSQDLEEGVREISFRANPLRVTGKETSCRRWPDPHHAIDEVNARATRPITLPKSGHNNFNVVRTSSRSAKYGLHGDKVHGTENKIPRNPLKSFDKPSQRYSDRSRPTDAKSPAESGGLGIPTPLEKRGQSQPDLDLKGSLSRAPCLVARVPMRPYLSDRRQRKMSEHTSSSRMELKQTQTPHQVETESSTRQGVENHSSRAAAQDQRPSDSTNDSGNLYAPDQILAGPLLQRKHVKNGQQVQTTATCEPVSKHDHSADRSASELSRSSRHHQAERFHLRESATGRYDDPRVVERGEASYRQAGKVGNLNTCKNDPNREKSKTSSRMSRVKKPESLEDSKHL